MTSVVNLATFASGSAVFSGDNKPWYENVSYEDSKDLIREKINSAKESFVSIGYYLKYIKKNELYKEDGYDDIHSFAQAEFNFSTNTTDRYMQLNDQFSVGGNSPELEDKYTGSNLSQLFEMLPMKEEDRDTISSDMTVKEIRQVKNEVKDIRDPSTSEIKKAMEYFNFTTDNPCCQSINELKKHCIDTMGKCHEGGGHSKFNFLCTPRGIKINSNDEITWNSFAKKVFALLETETIDNGVSVSHTRQATEEEKDHYNSILDNAKHPDPIVDGMTDIPDFSEDSKSYEKYEEISELSDEELLKELISKQESLLKDMKNAFTDSDIRVRKQPNLVNALHSYEL